jgi:DNA polymerase III delta subunit
MLFAELKTSLSQLKKGYLLTGSDVFLINKSIELIIAAAGVEILSVVRFDEGVAIAEVNLALSNVSMFGDRTLVVVRGIDTTRVYLQPLTGERELEKVDCNPMTEELVVKLIKRAGSFTDDGAVLLARICDNNYAAVSNEIEKLLSLFPNKKIEVADINATVTKDEKYQIYELANAVLKRDRKKVAELLDNFQNGDTDDYAVFASLVSFARRLFYIKCAAPTAPLATFLGVHPYAVTVTKRDSGQITPARATEIYRLALQLDFEIKSGRIYAAPATHLIVAAFLGDGV